MLEIIALVFLSRQIGMLAQRKGQPAGWWKFYMVIAWIAGEFLSILVAVNFLGVDELLTAFLFGIMGALGGYLMVRARLSGMPDKPGDTFDFEK